MQTIISEQSPQEKADHEAGHYVVATALKIPHRTAFVTIENSAPAEDGGVEGGCCALVFEPEPTPAQFGVYSMAGMTAQMNGILIRGGEDQAVALERVRLGGHVDFQNFREALGPDADDAPYTLRAFHILQSNWRLVVVLGDALKEHGTLYREEAEMILEAELKGSKKILDELAVYRTARREIQPPAQLRESRPGMKWFESLQNFMRREGRSFT